MEYRHACILTIMRAFRPIPPNLRVLALSRLHIIAICIALLAQRNYEYRPRKVVYKLNMPTLHHSTAKEKVWNMDETLREWKKDNKKFVQYELKGDEHFDELTLCAIEYDIRKMNMDFDQSRVIVIHFAASCTYGQFIQVCDIMKRELQPSYAFNDDYFYAFIHN